jgi:hypothetical protein
MDHSQHDSSLEEAFDEKVSSGLQSVDFEIVPESALHKDGITRLESEKDINYAVEQDERSSWQSWVVTKSLSCLSWLKVLLALQA